MSWNAVFTGHAHFTFFCETVLHSAAEADRSSVSSLNLKSVGLRREWTYATIQCKLEVDSSERVFLTSGLNMSKCICLGKHGRLQQTDVSMARLQKHLLRTNINTTAADLTDLHTLKETRGAGEYCMLTTSSVKHKPTDWKWQLQSCYSTFHNTNTTYSKKLMKR